MKAKQQNEASMKIDNPGNQPEAEPQKERTHKKITTLLMTRVAVLVALIVVCAQIYFPLPFTPVPITLQTLAIMACAVILPPLPAISAVTVYLLMGLCGIPVFHGFKSWDALLGPTGGFIAGFLPGAVFMAFMIKLLEKRSGAHPSQEIPRPKSRLVLKYLFLILLIIGFTCIVYALGIFWFMIWTERSFIEALFACAIPFLPGDAFKGIVIVLAYPQFIKLRNSYAKSL